MDIGAIISSPTRDPEWVRKCVITGLFALIPIAGQLNLLGWTKAAYQRAKTGDPMLPEPSLEYIGSGWALFLAILPAYLVLFGWSILVSVLGAMDLRAAALVGNLISFVLNLAISLVLVPALTYRHVTHGKGFADAFDVADISRIVTTNSGAFVSFALVAFLSNLIGGLGVVACCLGVILSLPFSAAVNATNIDAFERQTGL